LRGGRPCRGGTGRGTGCRSGRRAGVDDGHRAMDGGARVTVTDGLRAGRR
jgi:hypothetical protein